MDRHSSARGGAPTGTEDILNGHPDHDQHGPDKVEYVTR